MITKTNAFDIRNFSFTYAGAESSALKDIDLSIGYGEFITLCGKSGSGKSTLLRNLKSVLSPEGERMGEISFYGRKLSDVSNEEQSRRIGFVLQDPDNQVVTDKVWHELAFGLENLGVEGDSIRIRVAEMATYFGISPWINKDVADLSGGQKQLLNLASVMVMSPDILILDEPTSALDPIASEEFIDTLIKINKDIGTTVIISEHNLDQVMPASDRVIVMDKGRILADDAPRKVSNRFSSREEELFLSMPAPLRIYMDLQAKFGEDSRSRRDAATEDSRSRLNEGAEAPLTVRDGRDWLTDLFKGKSINKITLKRSALADPSEKIKIKDIRFRYERNSEDVIKSLGLDIGKGMVTTIVGGNGSGKSTLLRIIAGIIRPYRGKILPADSEFILLPQNPQTLFIGDTVAKELEEINDDPNAIKEVLDLLDLSDLADRHAYDLSGGEQQRVAFAKVLLKDAEIYLLDEPTTGSDGYNKKVLGSIIRNLAARGKTIIMVTHDLEFAAKYSDVCHLLFDGQVMSSGRPPEFFSNNTYYTTVANRMSRHIFNESVTCEDVLDLCFENLNEDDK